MKLDDFYLNRSKDLRATASINSDAARANNTRAWNVLTDADWKGDLFNIEQLGAAFGRDSLNANYQDAFAPDAGAKVGHVAAIKIQADYLAAQERAFRLRHASSVRCQVHAAGRKAGHADNTDGIFARVDTYVQDFISGAEQS